MKHLLCMILSCCILFSMITVNAFAATTGDMCGGTDITIMGSTDKEKMVTYDHYIVFQDGSETRIRTTAYAIYSQIEHAAEMINVAYTFYGIYESGFYGNLEVDGDSAVLEVYFLGELLLTMTFRISPNGNMTHIVYPVNGDPIVKDY